MTRRSVPCPTVFRFQDDLLCLARLKSLARNVGRIIFCSQSFASLIKVLLTGDALSTYQSLTAIIDEAHKKGARVAVHATELSRARTAVKAGADILAHSVFDDLLNEDFLNLIKMNNIIYIPTLAVDDGYRKVLYERARVTPIERACGDPEVIATWAELASPVTYQVGDDPTVAEENLRRVARAGIKIAAGSDAGNIGSLHGPSFHRELERMSEAGLSPRQVLLAATRDAAISEKLQLSSRAVDLCYLER